MQRILPRWRSVHGMRAWRAAQRYLGHSQPPDHGPLSGGSCGRGGVGTRNLRLVESGSAAAGRVEFSGSYEWRIGTQSGKSSRIGHVYDLASDAVVAILLFIAIGIGVRDNPAISLQIPPAVLGLLAGCVIALIFFLRMRIEDIAGNAASQQGSLAGFETQDVFYLLPLVTLGNAVLPFLVAAALCAPLLPVWLVIDYRRVPQLQSARVAQ